MSVCAVVILWCLCSATAIVFVRPCRLPDGNISDPLSLNPCCLRTNSQPAVFPTVFIIVMAARTTDIS